MSLNRCSIEAHLQGSSRIDRLCEEKIEDEAHFREEDAKAGRAMAAREGPVSAGVLAGCPKDAGRMDPWALRPGGA